MPGHPLHLAASPKRKGDNGDNGHASAKSTERDLDSLQEIANRLQEFRDERDWSQFHTPRNLAVSISVEAGELLEHFQWVVDNDLEQDFEDRLFPISEELADVVIYVVQLAQVLDIPLDKAIDRKIALNADRYPVSTSRGSSKKQRSVANSR